MTKAALPTSPFDSSRYVGSVTYISPDAIKINLPHAASVSARQYSGYPVLGGQVGEFVFIEGEGVAVLGRITEVQLPDSERLKAEPAVGERPDAHPIGYVQLLTTLELSQGSVISGIPQHPRIGQHVYSAHPLLVKHVIEGGLSDPEGTMELATIPEDFNTKVNVGPKQMFGRHCAVLGATGGGKSWTVARIVQEAARLGGKIILVDPTGEFHTYRDKVHTVFLGGRASGDQDDRTFVAFPYWELTEADLFAIFQPSPQSQVPKLREAMKSLKLKWLLDEEDTKAKAAASGAESHSGSDFPAGAEEKDLKAGLYVKANQPRKVFHQQWSRRLAQVEAEGARYDIAKLCFQIIEECVQEPASRNWGSYDDRTRSFCETLISKIYSLLRSPSLRCLFHPGEFESLTDHITRFLYSDDRVLRISMEFLSFEHGARELLTNAVARFLLGMARSGQFANMPTVVVLDEAHQFLNKSMGDENNRIHLDAFGLIAKEGRKYGLTTVLATQRPRDIPEDVLSQMGMFVVHRLINERDREVVEKACGSLDASAAAFLPTLGQGEAILVGVDFPMPTPVKVTKPRHPPKSEGPSFKNWRPQTASTVG
ncbi:ATP-binding protein [Cupriavidus pinatubonensis]|uniref:ATP-binding protein n=1 Tax=Cupriavidus pinatubonensis TaxID=248026 RepID=UPI001C739604|nr:ATP-binding protein [Cupriavidus pinatubonensis]QYY30860.1 ATP-binding protein [Cupriavidus pinatubonensis]